MTFFSTKVTFLRFPFILFYDFSVWVLTSFLLLHLPLDLHRKTKLTSSRPFAFSLPLCLYSSPFFISSIVQLIYGTSCWALFVSNLSKSREKRIENKLNYVLILILCVILMLCVPCKECDLLPPKFHHISYLKGGLSTKLLLFYLLSKITFSLYLGGA